VTEIEKTNTIDALIMTAIMRELECDEVTIKNESQATKCCRKKRTKTLLALNTKSTGYFFTSVKI